MEKQWYRLTSRSDKCIVHVNTFTGHPQYRTLKKNFCLQLNLLICGNFPSLGQNYLQQCCIYTIGCRENLSCGASGTFLQCCIIVAIAKIPSVGLLQGLCDPEARTKVSPVALNLILAIASNQFSQHHCIFSKEGCLGALAFVLACIPCCACTLQSGQAAQRAPGGDLGDDDGSDGYDDYVRGQN